MKVLRKGLKTGSAIHECDSGSLNGVSLPPIPPATRRKIQDSAGRAIDALFAESCGLARLSKRAKSAAGFTAYDYTAAKALLGLRTVKWQKDIGATSILKEKQFSDAIEAAMQRDDFEFFTRMGRILSSDQCSPQDYFTLGNKVHWYIVQNWTKASGKIPELCRLTARQIAQVCCQVFNVRHITEEQVNKMRRRLRLVSFFGARVQLQIDQQRAASTR